MPLDANGVYQAAPPTQKEREEFESAEGVCWDDGTRINPEDPADMCFHQRRRRDLE